MNSEGKRCGLNCGWWTSGTGGSSEKRGRSAATCPSENSYLLGAFATGKGQLGNARFVEVAKAQFFHSLVLILGCLRQR